VDSLVVKYLLWTLLAYGLQLAFALTQLFLCVYLVIGGGLLLSGKESLGKWGSRFGFTPSPAKDKKPWVGWLMIVAGVALLLPFVAGAPYGLTIIATLLAIGLLLYVSQPLAKQGIRVGRLARKLVVCCAALVFCLTLWEGGDLIGMAKSVAVKAKYWRDKEVAGWQAENNPNAPKIGSLAPDFELTDHAGEKTVRLSDLRGGKPVVLVFGSFT
jgi:hypothetical protein